jgi:hypothetical protein
MISVSGYAECRISFIVMLSVVMPSVIVLSVTFHLMLCSVSLMSVIMLIVLAQCDTTELPLCYFMTHCHWMYKHREIKHAKPGGAGKTTSLLSASFRYFTASFSYIWQAILT